MKSLFVRAIHHSPSLVSILLPVLLIPILELYRIRDVVLFITGQTYPVKLYMAAEFEAMLSLISISIFNIFLHMKSGEAFKMKMLRLLITIITLIFVWALCANVVGVRAPDRCLFSGIFPFVSNKGVVAEDEKCSRVTLLMNEISIDDECVLLYFGVKGHKSEAIIYGRLF